MAPRGRDTEHRQQQDSKNANEVIKINQLSHPHEDDCESRKDPKTIPQNMAPRPL